MTGKIKIGFIVKQPEEPWFQLEWRFAQQAAEANKFELVKIGAVDGEKALAAIDNLAAQQAQGFVICTPDTRLGPAIAAKARAAKLKLLTVDDQFLGADGKPMADVHHLGISARNIGHMVGKALAEEMKKRGWSADETALCAVTFEELATARERTDGAIETIVETGFAKEKIFKVAQKTSDVPGAFDAANILLTQHPEAFRAVVSFVGIYDMVRHETFPNGAFNVTEYGTTADSSEFAALYGYSPLHHVKRATAYPAVLMETGVNDPLVAPWQSRKFAAALQAATTSGRPVVLLTRMEAGHGIGAPFAQRVGNAALALTFFAHELGLRPADSTRARPPLNDAPKKSEVRPK